MAGALVGLAAAAPASAGARPAGGKVFVNRARVVQPDVLATNGVIHVVNRVLIPR